MHTPEDGDCVFSSVLQSLSALGHPTTYHSAKQLRSDVINLVLSGTEKTLTEFGANELGTNKKPLEASLSEILDIAFPAVMKILGVRVRVACENHLGVMQCDEIVDLYGRDDPTGRGRPLVTVFRVVNLHHEPPIDHYLASRPLGEGQKALVPPEYLCPAPQTCKISHPQIQGSLQVLQADLEDSKESGLEFHYAQLYCLVLQVPVEPIATASAVDESKAQLKLENGTVYYKHAGNVDDWVSVGQNWLLPILRHASLIPPNEDAWFRGSVITTARERDHIQARFEEASRCAHEQVRKAVAQNLELLRVVQNFYSELLNSPSLQNKIPTKQASATRNSEQSESPDEPRSQKRTSPSPTQLSVNDQDRGRNRKRPQLTANCAKVPDPASPQKRLKPARTEDPAVNLPKDGVIVLPTRLRQVDTERVNSELKKFKMIGIDPSIPGAQTFAVRLAGLAVDEQDLLVAKSTLFVNLWTEYGNCRKETDPKSLVAIFCDEVRRIIEVIRGGIDFLVQNRTNEKHEMLGTKRSLWNKLIAYDRQAKVPDSWFVRQNSETKLLWPLFLGQADSTSTENHRRRRELEFIDCVVVGITMLRGDQ